MSILRMVSLLRGRIQDLEYYPSHFLSTLMSILKISSPPPPPRAPRRDRACARALSLQDIRTLAIATDRPRGGGDDWRCSGHLRCSLVSARGQLRIAMKVESRRRKPKYWKIKECTAIHELRKSEILYSCLRSSQAVCKRI